VTWGGTFDVSVVEITGEVTEVLASHGNNQLGGDDFDRRLQLHLAEQFASSTALLSPMIQLPSPTPASAEQIKITLSSHAFAPVREAF